jgi:type 1 glutamine amidotransferase
VIKMQSLKWPAKRLTLVALLLLIFGPTSFTVSAQERVLVFSKTTGFRHPSIDDGIAMLQSQAANNAFVIELSENAADFNPTNLSRFRAVVWLNTTGDVLDATQQVSFQTWLENGGGYLGIHAAADCEYAWPWYGASVLGNGAWFQAHPAIQAATVLREDATDISTAHLSANFSMTEEWYNFRANPRPQVTVLLKLDESSYNPGTGAMGADHPISWKRSVGLGRSFYTGMGHRSETYADQRFQLHVKAALQGVTQTHSTTSHPD